jgi:hypothetical protein
MTRLLTGARPPHAFDSVSLTDFYREEFLKHRACLEEQRECYSELTVAQLDAALARVMSRLDTLCRRHDCNQVIADLLKQFDVLTGLSAWSDPKTYH